MSDDDPKAALAAEAERLKRERDAAEAKQKNRAQKQEREQALDDAMFSSARMRKSVSRTWVFWWGLGLLLMGALIGFSPDEDAPKDWPHETLMFGSSIMAIGALMLAVHYSGNARFRRWSAGLPFRLEGVEPVLGSGRAATAAALDIEFKDTPPPRDVVAELLRARVPQPTQLQVAVTWALENNDLSRETANYPVAFWLERVVNKVLLDVHRAYPIVAVTLRVLKDDELYVPSGD